MSLVQFLRILWARRMVILGLLGVGLVAALIALKVTPTRYEAQSRVMMDFIKPDPVSGEVLSSGYVRTYVRTQIQLIRDYKVTGKVVDNLGWLERPDLQADYAARPGEDQRDFRRYLADMVRDQASAELLEGSNILEITFKAAQPDVAQRGADALRDAYVEQTLAGKREAAQRSAEFFEGQAGKVRDQLAAAESRKTAYEKQTGIVLTDANIDLDSAKLNALASAAAVPALAGASVPRSTAGVMQLAQIDAQLAQMREQLGPSHPDVQAVVRQRAAVAAAAAQERAAADAASRPAETTARLSGQVDNQTQKVLAQREKLERLKGYAVDVSVLRDQYAKSAQRAATLRQQADSNESGLTLLGNAVAPEEPASPNKPLILLGGLGGGLALGLLIALVLELVSRRVRSAEDLSRTGLPIVVILGSGGPGPERVPLVRRLMSRESPAL